MKPKILYIYPTFSTFIQKDLDFLSKKYNVKTPNHTWGNKKEYFLTFFKHLYFLVSNIRTSKAIFVMFAGYWSFIPVILGRFTNTPVYIILGGTECVSFPTINYGSLRKKTLAWFIKFSLKYASKLLPVSQSLVYTEYNYYQKSKFKFQGYKYFFPQIKTPVQVIFNGFNPDKSPAKEKPGISNTFICVANIPDQKRFKLKGIDQIFSLANKFKSCQFTIVGVSENVILGLDKVPSNINLLPFLTQEEFNIHLLNSEFYIHLSISEGFPNSLAEAMLCNCIPIGSNVGAIPIIIQDSGFIFKSDSFDYTENAFREVLEKTAEERIILAKKARARIVSEFHIQRREEAFFNLIEMK